MTKVFVSTYPYGRVDTLPRKLLENESNVQVAYNPYSRKLTAKEVADLASDYEVIIAGTEDLSLLIENNSRLGLISRVGIGLDNVDLIKCKRKGIRVCYTPDAVTDAVAELTIGLMISITRQIVTADREIREGHWIRHYGARLENSTIGLLGFGRVGMSVARLLSVFKSKILVHDIRDVSDDLLNFRRQGNNIESVTKEELFANSDIISLHLPAYSKTSEIISKDTLAKFKKSAYLINTARGELINEEDLFHCLENQQIAGAALDVFQKEPYNGNFNKLPNVILTQHMGSCSFDCRLAMESQAAEDVIRFLRGESLLREVPEQEYSYL